MVSRHFIVRGLAILSLATLAGCMAPAINDPARIGPFYTPTNFVGERSLGGVRRVVVLPVYGGSLASEETVALYDPIFAEALQQQHRFEVVRLTRDDCRRKFRVSEFSSVAALPHDFMGAIRREFAADAVLFVDITVFRPYRPMALGFRAKLATVEATRLIWSFDDTFSTDNPTVANGARHFSLTADRGDVPADLTHGVLQSPARFAGYAAATMFATLPPVVAPEPPPAAGVVSAPKKG
jgi:hypothetical protein